MEKREVTIEEHERTKANGARIVEYQSKKRQQWSRALWKSRHGKLAEAEMEQDGREKCCVRRTNVLGVIVVSTVAIVEGVQLASNFFQGKKNTVSI